MAIRFEHMRSLLPIYDSELSEKKTIYDSAYLKMNVIIYDLGNKVYVHQGLDVKSFLTFHFYIACFSKNIRRGFDIIWLE